MARSHVGLGTDFTRFVNQFYWATNQLRSSGDPLGTHFWAQESCRLGTQEVALTGFQLACDGAQFSLDPVGTSHNVARAIRAGDVGVQGSLLNHCVVARGK